MISAFAVATLVLISVSGYSPANANPAGIEIADRLIDLLKSYDAKDVSYDDADYDSGSDITTIYGFEMINPEGEGTLTIQNIQMTGVKLHASGALSADELVASKTLLAGLEDDASFNVRMITVQNPLFPEKSATEGKNNAFAYRLASEFLMENILISDKDITVPIESIYIGRGPLDGDIPETLEFAVNNVVVQTDEISDPDPREQLEKFGYEEIDISFSSVWSWDSAAEEAVIGPISFSAVDMGTVTLDLSLGGVSRELLLAVEDRDRAMELAQLLSFISLQYALEDDSITDRVISVMSDEADLSPSTLIGIWVDLARRQMMDQELPEDFIKMVVKASEYFFNNPGTIRLAAEPEAPIPAGQLMGSVMFGPAALIAQLNITVTAE